MRGLTRFIVFNQTLAGQRDKYRPSLLVVESGYGDQEAWNPFLADTIMFTVLEFNVGVSI